MDFNYLTTSIVETINNFLRPNDTNKEQLNDFNYFSYLTNDIIKLLIFYSIVSCILSIIVVTVFKLIDIYRNFEESMYYLDDDSFTFNTSSLNSSLCESDITSITSDITSLGDIDDIESIESEGIVFNQVNLNDLTEFESQNVNESLTQNNTENNSTQNNNTSIIYDNNNLEKLKNDLNNLYNQLQKIHDNFKSKTENI